MIQAHRFSLWAFLQMIKFLKKHSLILITLLFIGSIYFYTTPPGIVISKGDSVQLAITSRYLGFSVTSGYPVYICLNKILTDFSPVNTFYILSLLSGLWGVISLWILYLILEKITSNKLIPPIIILLIGFSPVMWSQANIPEVYTLNLVFIALLFFLVWKFELTRNWKYAYLIGYIVGLSTNHHQTIVLFAPFIALYLIYRGYKKPWRIIITFLLFLLGISFFLYGPVRGVRWFKQYPKDFGFWEDIFSSKTWNLFWAAISGSKFKKSMFGYSFSELFWQLKRLFILFYYQFPLWGLPIIIYGIYASFKKQPRFFAFITACFIPIFIFFANYRVFDYKVFMLPCFFILSLFFAAPMEKIVQIRDKFNFWPPFYRLKLITSKILIYIFLLIIPFFSLLNSWEENNNREDYYNYEPFLVFLRNSPLNTKIFSTGDLKALMTYYRATRQIKENRLISWIWPPHISRSTENKFDKYLYEIIEKEPIEPTYIFLFSREPFVESKILKACITKGKKTIDFYTSKPAKYKEGYPVNFGNVVVLDNADIYPLRIQPGDSIHTDFTWHALEESRTDKMLGIKIFVHFIRKPGWGFYSWQMDHFPVYDQYPINWWPLDKYIKEDYSKRIPLLLIPGEYEVWMGVWDHKQRLKIYDKNGNRIGDKDRILVNKIKVEYF